MYVSQETPEQIEARLARVLAAAELRYYPEPYAFYEYPVGALATVELDSALALVRDTQVWSVLKPADDRAAEIFGLFSFHFQDGSDNSGFVGWLATELKRQLGTGVFVVCGQNSMRGGIFDYWGIPWGLLRQAQAALSRMRGATDR